MKRKKEKRLIIRSVVFCAFLLTLFSVGGHALSEALVVRNYRIASKKLSNSEPVRIVLISDLHGYSFGGDQQPLIAEIQNAKPDIILLTGDLFDSRSKDHGAEQLLEGIHDLAPCFFVTGNHEIANGRRKALATVQKYGVIVLEGTKESVTIKEQTIQVMGIDDPLYYKNKSMERILRPISGFDSNYFSILMSHRPERIELFSEYGFDLVVSGHTHGGQIRIPFFVNGFYTPSQGWFPKYVGGLYEVHNTTLIISRGLSNESEVPRINNPPEVVVIELVASD